MTEVYVFDREGVTLPEEAAELLPPWRRELWMRLGREESRQESLCAGLLYAFAMERLGVPRGARVSRLPLGKPVLAERDDVFFSLSHSVRYVMCAVSDHLVGADVQQERPVKLTIARRFHPDERDWLSRQPEEEHRTHFFRIWTRKEAWVKAVSDGRVLSLDEADVIHRLPGLFFRDYVLPGGYRAAVCAADDDIPASPAAVGRDALLAAPEILAGR